MHLFKYYVSHSALVWRHDNQQNDNQPNGYTQPNKMPNVVMLRVNIIASSEVSLNVVVVAALPSKLSNYVRPSLLQHALAVTCHSA